jgi:antitoxin ParD1/3/4
MAKISISMSDKMEKYVADRVESGDFNNTSEYFRDLVRRDEDKQLAEAKLRAMIEDARRSGISEKTFDEIWEAGVAKAKRKKRAAG